jgi:hypothetical protein
VSEIFYGYPSAAIALAILALTTIAMETGFRAGRRAAPRTGESARSQVQAMQASLLGVLALMLGFTFSIALERFNSRSEALVHEANAIGTAYLRSALLPEGLRAEAGTFFAHYADARATTVTLTWKRRAERGPLNAEAQRLQGRLWAQAADAARVSSSPAIAGLYLQSLNEMFDAHASVMAQVNRHVPLLVLLLLFGAFVISGGLIGYVAGLANDRPRGATLVMVALVVLLMFMIMDLDRPRRGIIQVNPQALLDAKAAIDWSQDAGRLRSP